MKKLATLLISLLFIVTSCQMTKPRAERMLTKVEVYDKTMFAEPCARLYPVVSEKETEYIYIQGKTDTIVDTAFVDCTDTVNEGKVVQVPCKSYTRTDTTKVIETVTKESTARVDSTIKYFTKTLEECAEANNEKDRIIDEWRPYVEKYKKLTRTLKWVVATILIGGIVAAVVKFKLLKFIV